MLHSNSGAANCPVSSGRRGPVGGPRCSGFKLGLKFSIPGLLQSCSTSQLANPALPPGQLPGWGSKWRARGRALADGYHGRLARGAPEQSAPDVNILTTCSFLINTFSLSLVFSETSLQG